MKTPIWILAIDDVVCLASGGIYYVYVSGNSIRHYVSERHLRPFLDVRSHACLLLASTLSCYFSRAGRRRELVDGTS